MWGTSKASNSDPYRTVLPPGANGSPALGTVILATGEDGNGQPLVSPRGTSTRDLYISGRDEGKKMAHAGHGNGDYVQVTTFRYVGKGGNFNMVPVDREESQPQQSCCCPGCFPACCVALCVLLFLAGIAWVVWPEEGVAAMEETVKQTFAQSSRFLPSKSESTTATSTMAIGIGGIDVTMGMGNIDFAKIMATPKLSAAFDAAVKEAVTFYAGHGITVDRVGVTVLPATDKVHADMVPPCGVDVVKMEAALNFTSLARAVVANLNTVGGFEETETKPMTVRIHNSQSFSAPCNDPAAIKALATRKDEREAARADHEAKAEAEELSKSCEVLVVRGADGPSAKQVNGVYSLQDVKFNDRLLFQKRYTPDVWVAFMRGRWYVTDTQRKNDNSGGGWLYSVEPKGERPADVEQWSEWNGNRWVTKASISVSCSEAYTLRTSNAWCQNWRHIKLGAESREGSAKDCGKRCEATHRCVGFNYVDSATCSGHLDPGKQGACTLWKGPCVGEHHSCKADYMLAN